MLPSNMSDNPANVPEFREGQRPAFIAGLRAGRCEGGEDGRAVGLVDRDGVEMLVQQDEHYRVGRLGRLNAAEALAGLAHWQPAAAFGC